MANISSVSGLSSLSEDLYYQYMINHNSTSTMLNALSGNTSDDSGSGSLLSAVTSSLYSSGLTGLDGLNSLSGIGSLLGGGSEEDLLGASQSLSSFSNILQTYLSAQTAEAAQMTEKLSGVLEEAAETEDTSTLSYRTVQEIYQYFLDKTSSSVENAVQSNSSQSQGSAGAIASQQTEVDFDSLEQQLQEEAESVMPALAQKI